MVNWRLKIESKILAMFKKTAKFVSISGQNIEISILSLFSVPSNPGTMNVTIGITIHPALTEFAIKTATVLKYLL